MNRSIGKATSPEAYRLLHDGAVALARVEANGIRVDVGYLERAVSEAADRILGLQGKLRDSEEWGVWRRRFGRKAKLGSLDQLAQVLFEDMGHAYPGGDSNRTASGRYKADEEVLGKVRRPFVRDYLGLRKLQKMKSTYLEGILREVVDGRLHPFFNLHTARTFRSSSSDPNFQNIPIRNREIGEAVRRCFVPSPGRVLVEVDFSGIEVRVAYCYHRDPTMRKYLLDPSTDMHRDTAADLFLLPVDFLKEHKDWAKRGVRDWAKNRFVFPEFYGSVYFQCAPNLWQGVRDEARVWKGGGGDGRPRSPLGMSLRDHLRSKGVRKLGSCNPGEEPAAGTFERRVKEVEDSFWRERFPVYTEWKRRWWDRYQREGGFDMLTGFRVDGLFKRNEVLNYAVQGSAFHCLLWSLVRIQRWLDRNGMEARLIGQIHDSVLADVPLGELQDYLTAARRVMVEELPAAWPWIVIPLEVEAEVAEESWAAKRVWEDRDGKWKPK